MPANITPTPSSIYDRLNRLSQMVSYTECNPNPTNYIQVRLQIESIKRDVMSLDTEHAAISPVGEMHTRLEHA